MAKLEEGKQAGEFLACEANGTRSREEVVVKDGEVLVAGQLFSLDVNEKAITYVDGATVAGIAFDNVSPSGADGKVAAIVRDAEVVEASLVVFTGATTANIATAVSGLKALGIITR